MFMLNRIASGPLGTCATTFVEAPMIEGRRPQPKHKWAEGTVEVVREAFAEHAASMLAVFRALDRDGNGTVSVAEFIEGVTSMRLGVPEKQCHYEFFGPASALEA